MQDAEVTQLATAIAKANGHSEPESWAATVLSHFKADLGAVEQKVEAVAQSVETHVEQAVQVVENVFQPHVAADQEINHAAE